jgi:hypothetical protein
MAAKSFKPCPCTTCTTPEEREAIARVEALERTINRIAFAAFCADRDSGEPTRLPSYYRQLAEQEYEKLFIREEAIA